MKSKHRHELKTNELAEWLANLPQWAQENLKTIIYISAVVILVAGSFIWHQYQKNVVSIQKQSGFTDLVSRVSQSKMFILQGRLQGIDKSPMLLQPAEDLQISAQDADNDNIAALAMIKRAQALRMELHYRQGPVREEDIKAQTEKAKASYIKAIEKSPSNPSLMATARLGLGLCEEELGNFDDAKQIYDDLTADPNFEGTTAFVTAGHRLKTMDDYQDRITFKSSPRPRAIEPAEKRGEIMPEILPSANDIADIGDINLPIDFNLLESP